MENWVGLWAKRLYQTPKNLPLKKRGFGRGILEGAEGERFGRELETAPLSNMCSS